MIKKILTVLAIVGLSACGSESIVGDGYPDVGGTYNGTWTLSAPGYRTVSVKGSVEVVARGEHISMVFVIEGERIPSGDGLMSKTGAFDGSGCDLQFGCGTIAGQFSGNNLTIRANFDSGLSLAFNGNK